MFSDANSIQPGKSSTLAPAGPYATPPDSYGPQKVGDQTLSSFDTLINVLAGDSGDGGVVSASIQPGLITSGQQQTDCLIKAEWGATGAPNFAYMKLGLGLVFSVPGSFLRVTVQNLLAKMQVIAGSAMYPLRGTSVNAPRYSFDIVADGANLLTYILVGKLYDFYADKANWGPPFLLAPAMRNTTPVPFFIPPFASKVSVYIVGGIANFTYPVDQMVPFGPGTTLGKHNQIVTDASGNGNLEDIDLLTEIQELLISTVAPITQGQFTFDFKLAL
jgi:hypothetical protein